MKTAFIVAVVFAAVASATVLNNKKADFTMHTRIAPEGDAKVTVPKAWLLTAKPAPEKVITLTFAVKQQNTDKLEAIFWEVSDPKNDRYGQHMTLEEVTALVGAKQSDLDAVRTFIEAHNIVDYRISNTRDFIIAKAPVSVAEKMLKVELNEYTHVAKKSLKIVRAATHYTLPASVAASVDYVSGVSAFPNVKKPMREMQPRTPFPEDPMDPNGKWPSTCGQRCAGYITPQIIRQKYNVTGTAKQGSQAVAEFDNQYYSPEDLSSYLTGCGLPDQKATTVGQNDPSRPGGEATLDIQLIMAVGQGVPSTFWSASAFEDFTTFLEQLSSHPNPPKVVSVSYGQDEDNVGQQQADRGNKEFMKVGARGISVLFASGDNGVWGVEPIGDSFRPDYPAGSPYITSVGATNLKGDTIDSEEIGSDWSGGGFSTLFNAPSYQTEAVNTYFKNQGSKLPPAHYWNKQGKLYPDVSANGGSSQPYCVIDQGRVMPGAGTSIACPVVAGIIGLLNSKRLEAGKSTLGFLNPLFYQNPDMFNDVTSGYNNVPFQVDLQQGSTQKGPAAFYADKGVDPVSGLGTPNYANMASVVETLR